MTTGRSTSPALRATCGRALRRPGGRAARRRRSGPSRSSGTTWTSPTSGSARTPRPSSTRSPGPGYEGTQLGLGFPEGSELRDALAARGLRLAEVYASLPATADGPTDGRRRRSAASGCASLDRRRRRGPVRGPRRLARTASAPPGRAGAPGNAGPHRRRLAPRSSTLAARPRRATPAAPAAGWRSTPTPARSSRRPAEVDRLVAATDPDARAALPRRRPLHWSAAAIRCARFGATAIA